MAEYSEVPVGYYLLPNATGSPPSYATPGSCAVDITAAIYEPMVIAPGQFVQIPTGIMLEIPNGYEATMRPRSGLAFMYGITVINSPGTIDSDFRGEVKVLLINHGRNSYVVSRGDRIAQMVVSPVYKISWVKKYGDDMTNTERGSGGFGSTGR